MTLQVKILFDIITNGETIIDSHNDVFLRDVMIQLQKHQQMLKLIEQYETTVTIILDTMEQHS